MVRSSFFLLGATLLAVSCGSPPPQEEPAPSEIHVDGGVRDVHFEDITASASATASPNSSTNGPGSERAAPPNPSKAMVAPTRLKVAHVLIAFRGAARSTATRSREEAESLAKDLFQRAKDGADIRALMKEHSDDPGPGVYGMFTDPPARQPGDYPASGMVPAFGEIGFSLAVGETGLAVYDPAKSPFGWHVIQRVE